MKIIAIDRIMPSASDERIREVVIQEAIHTWVLYSNDVIRELYFRKDRPGVVLVLECPSVGDARMLLSSFPLVKAGVIEFDIIPVGYFVPFGTLFSQDLMERLH
ncbi:MAG: hypothetical protein FD123_1603 [Bacteroidetes bacterium]|nr:MAG: hypothetical protein FD123_1603 [Bacteroidota bacterium]